MRGVHYVYCIYVYETAHIHVYSDYDRKGYVNGTTTLGRPRLRNTDFYFAYTRNKLIDLRGRLNPFLSSIITVTPSMASAHCSLSSKCAYMNRTKEKNRFLKPWGFFNWFARTFSMYPLSINWQLANNTLRIGAASVRRYIRADSEPFRLLFNIYVDMRNLWGHSLLFCVTQ